MIETIIKCLTNNLTNSHDWFKKMQAVDNDKMEDCE